MQSTRYSCQILNLNYLDRFSKNTKIQNFMKIRPFGAKLFHADGQTDMPKVTVALRNFANAPKNITTLRLMAGIRRNTELLSVPYDVN
jgi:hypothetical protein